MTYLEMLTCTALFFIDCFFGASLNNMAPTPPPTPSMSGYSTDEEFPRGKLEIPESLDWEMLDHDDWGMLLGEK